MYLNKDHSVYSIFWNSKPFKQDVKNKKKQKLFKAYIIYKFVYPCHNKF